MKRPAPTTRSEVLKIIADLARPTVPGSGGSARFAAEVERGLRKYDWPGPNPWPITVRNQNHLPDEFWVWLNSLPEGEDEMTDDTSFAMRMKKRRAEKIGIDKLQAMHWGASPIEVARQFACDLVVKPKWGDGDILRKVVFDRIGSLCIDAHGKGFPCPTITQKANRIIVDVRAHVNCERKGIAFEKRGKLRIVAHEFARGPWEVWFGPGHLPKETIHPTDGVLVDPSHVLETALRSMATWEPPKPKPPIG